jgi:hypothetical protein
MSYTFSLIDICKPHEERTMDLRIDTAKLAFLLDELCEARIQTHTGFVPDLGEPEGFDDRGEPLAKRGSYKKNTEGNKYSEARTIGRMQLFRATKRLRQTMSAVGREVAFNPTYGPNIQIDDVTFDKLFGELGFELLRTSAAVEGFQEGVESLQTG